MRKPTPTALTARLPTPPAPALFAADAATERRFWEFFTATIRNANTRAAYLAACTRFADWCRARNLALHEVEPMVVAAYVETLTQRYAPSTVKQQLAALRRLFDWFVISQVLTYNPASAVRGPREVLREGKTPVLTGEEARRLLETIPDDTLVGLRDRALIGLMLHSFARVSAAIAMTVSDYYTQGKRSFLRLHEKGGKYLVVPAHHRVQELLDAYLEAAGIGEDRAGPLFRTSGRGRAANVLVRSAMTRHGAIGRIKHHARAAGLPEEICNHSLRGTGITAYLAAGGTIEMAARIAGHASTRTTQLYDRTAQAPTLDEIERIRF